MAPDLEVMNGEPGGARKVGDVDVFPILVRRFPKNISKTILPCELL
jgi:hypothetical protein